MLSISCGTSFKKKTILILFSLIDSDTEIRYHIKGNERNPNDGFIRNKEEYIYVQLCNQKNSRRHRMVHP